MGVNSDADRLHRLGVTLSLLDINMTRLWPSWLKKKNREPRIRRISGKATSSS